MAQDLTTPTTGAIEAMLVEVVSVDARAKTVDVKGKTSNSTPIKVPLAYGYAHGSHAGGILYMPEVGATAWLGTMPDRSHVILCYVNSPDLVPAAGQEALGDTELSYAGKQDFLEQGDIRIACADGNQVILRRGGIVQLGSTAMSQMMFIPLENLLRIFAQRFQLRSPLGEIDWGHATLTTSSGAVDTAVTKETPVLIKYSWNETAQDVHDAKNNMYAIEVRLGRLDSKMLDTDHQAGEAAHIFGNKMTHPAGGDTSGDGVGLVSVTIYDRTSTADDRVSFKFQLSKSGACFIKLQRDLHIETAGNAILDVTGAGKLVLKVNGGKVYLVDEGATQQVVLGNVLTTLLSNLIDKLVAHVHPTPSGPSGVPANAADFLLLQTQNLKPVAGALTAAILSDKAVVK